MKLEELRQHGADEIVQVSKW